MEQCRCQGLRGHATRDGLYLRTYLALSLRDSSEITSLEIGIRPAEDSLRGRACNLRVALRETADSPRRQSSRRCRWKARDWERKPPGHRALPATQRSCVTRDSRPLHRKRKSNGRLDANLQL